MLFCTGVFVLSYIKFANIQEALFVMLDQYIPIAGVAIFISLVMQDKYYTKSTSKNQLGIMISFCFYIIFLIVVQFTIKEIGIVKLQSKPDFISQPLNAPQGVILQEFDHINELPTKKGVFLRNSETCFLFGTLAQQNPKSYLVQHIFFAGMDESGRRYALLSEHAKILSNKIVLYKATVFTKSNSTWFPDRNLPKNYALPISFDIDTIFTLWNTTDPRQITLLPIILNNIFIESFMLPIALASFNYILNLVFLFLICSLGLGMLNSLSFKGGHFIGSTSVLCCSYPFCLLIYYYLSLIVQATIHYYLRI